MKHSPHKKLAIQPAAIHREVPLEKLDIQLDYIESDHSGNWASSCKWGRGTREIRNPIADDSKDHWRLGFQRVVNVY